MIEEKSDFPTGTVTFLFTDIEGSTRLLHGLGEAYKEVMQDHRALMRQAFANWNGQEVDTQGDSFFVAFSSASEALSAAIESQRALHNHVWPNDAEVRVRMALSPDGTRFATPEGSGGSLKIFSLWSSLDELIEIAKECCVSRQLTAVEREQFGLPALLDTVDG